MYHRREEETDILRTQTETRSTTYIADHVAFFRRSREKHGQLSNMTFGYPIKVNDTVFQSPEGLYQALKYPNCPDLQKQIGGQKSGMEAKKASYAASSNGGPMVRPDWDQIRVDAMRYTQAVRLRQHRKKFQAALLATGTWPIVELSPRDDFWGAKPQRANTILAGANMLGKILSHLRNTLRENQGDLDKTIAQFLEDTPVDLLQVNGRPVPSP